MANFERIDNIEKLSAFEHLINRTIDSISHCQLSHDNKPDLENDGDLEIKFSDNIVLTLTIMSDGESIDASIESMIIPDRIQELNLYWQKVELTKEKFIHLVGSRLVDIESIVDIFEHYKVLSGVRFTFSTSDSLIYLNNGDNAKIYLNDDTVILQKDKDFKTEIISIK
jgi:hypothetical protein